MKLHEIAKKDSPKKISMAYLEIFLQLNFGIKKEQIQEIFTNRYDVPAKGEPEFTIKLFKIEPKTPQEMMFTGGNPYSVIGFKYNGESYIHDAPEYLMNYLFYLISLESPTLYSSAEEVRLKWNTMIREREAAEEAALASQQVNTEEFKQ